MPGPMERKVTKLITNNYWKIKRTWIWTMEKIYKDGYDMFGNKISIHYFQSPSGKVFNVKVKIGWSD